MRLRFSFLLFLTVPFLFAHYACGQTPSPAHGASIHGTVYDPDGRAVAGAQVSLLASMVAVAQTETDGHGEYHFDALRGGTYTVAANLPGLTKVSGETKLQSADALTIDLHLDLSAVQEQVIVSASLGGALAPQIGSSVTVVGQQEIEDEGAETLADALRNLPGVAINRTGQTGAVTSAFIRGGTAVEIPPGPERPFRILPDRGHSTEAIGCVVSPTDIAEDLPDTLKARDLEPLPARGLAERIGNARLWSRRARE